MKTDNIGTGRFEEQRRERQGAISLCYIVFYLDWLCPEVQSEVQQERKKIWGFVCKRA